MNDMEMFDYENKPQKEDKELRKIVKSKFTANAAAYLISKYQFDLVKGDFNAYANKVKSILNNSGSAGIFIKRMNELNLEQRVAIF